MKVTYNDAWAAGLMEGEGCLSMHKRKGKDYYEFAIHCEMTDEDVVKTLHKVLGHGTVCQRPPRKNRSQTWVLSVQNVEGVRSVLERLRPYLHGRRKAKVSEMLKEMDLKYAS